LCHARAQLYLNLLHALLGALVAERPPQFFGLTSREVGADHGHFE